MNIIEYLLLLFLEKGDDVWETAKKDGWEVIKRKLMLTKRLLVTAIVVPLLLLGTGIVIGACGAEGVAQGFLRVAGFIATVLLVIFWIRAWAYANLFLAATFVGNAITEKVPKADSAKLRSLARWLRGITVWISVACLYAMVVPVWRHVGWSAVAAVSMLALAGIMTAGWFSGRLAQYAGLAFILSMLVFSTVVQFSPAFSQAVTAIAEENFGRLNGWGERKERMSGAAQAADKDADANDQLLLTQKLGARNRIREHAVKDCGGEFCSEQDKAKAAELDRDIEDLKNGTYWSKRKGNASPATTVQPVSVATASKTADLPPPPPVRKDPSVSPPPQAENDKPAPIGTSDRAKEICAKYPDLCK